MYNYNALLRGCTATLYKCGPNCKCILNWLVYEKKWLSSDTKSIKMKFNVLFSSYTNTKQSLFKSHTFAQLQTLFKNLKIFWKKNDWWSFYNYCWENIESCTFMSKHWINYTSKNVKHTQTNTFWRREEENKRKSKITREKRIH